MGKPIGTPHGEHMSDGRPDPDALLDSLRRRESARRRGRLKVFLGMCPGVGKTYAMLEAAHRELRDGGDTVVGYVETHGRRETDSLLAGLPALPRRDLGHRGLALSEFDLDATLARLPRLVLVDELAHTNAPGARHPKRWQDVSELLDAGIDVFTTLNVQHVESLAETVRQITGTEIRETVPDGVIDDATLELVDLPPAELIRRLGEGRVYVAERAEIAARNFFRESNLTALRELALRLVADHVGADTRELRRTHADPGPWKTAHRLLVAVGPGPLSEPLIRWTRRMADGLRCDWLAVHVGNTVPLTEAAQAQLSKNLATAGELGAEVIATTDDDRVRGLLRVAREHNATQIVFGKPDAARWLAGWPANRALSRLVRESGDIDVLVVRGGRSATPAPHRVWLPTADANPRQYLVAAAVMAATGIANVGLDAVVGPRIPGLVFLGAVVGLALFVGRGPVLLAGALGALGWNYFFLPPRFTLAIARAEDAVLFAMYFVVSLVLGQLVARIRAQQVSERARESRTTALYELTRDLAEASSRDEVVWHLVAQAGRTFQSPVGLALPSAAGLAAHPDGTLALSEKDLGVAEWAYRHRKAAGRFTGNLPGSGAIHLPLATERSVLGVLAVALPGRSVSIAQRDLLEAFARQAALVLDRIELRAAAEHARLLAESERLGRVLLNSISHELRTPLAASTSAADALAESADATAIQRRALVGEIQEANSRLNRVVGNLLDVARLDAGHVRPRLDWHDADDLVHTTLGEIRAELAGHPVRTDLPRGPVLARLDFSLTQHALANLLLNAARHTPAGTEIEIHAALEEGVLVLCVGDRGPGIAEEILPRIFDRFFRAPGAPAGGSGLGLAIARGFIEAQGGKVSAANRPGGGAVFTLRLPQTQSPPPMDSPA